MFTFFIFSANSQAVKLDINGNYTVQGTYGLYWKYRYKPTGSNTALESAVIQSSSAATIRLNPFVSWDFSRNFYDSWGQVGLWEDFYAINADYAAISKPVGYNFNFDTSAITEGWRGYRLQNTTASSYSNILETNFLVNGSTGKSISMAWYSGYGLMLVSPKIIDLSTDKKFSIYVNSYQGSNSLVLGTITDPYDATTFHPLKTVTLTGGTFNKIEVFLNNYNGQDKYIAIKNSGNSGDMYIDDFSYEQSVNCFDNTNLSVSNVNESNATVNFTADAAQTSWELNVKDVTHGGLTQTLNITTNNNYLLENLVGNTTYEVKVRANCAVGLYSNWTPLQTFTTPCASISSGYQTSFLESSFFNPCWTKIESGANIYQAPASGSTLSPKSGGKYVDMKNGSLATTQKSFIITPYITDLDNNKRIKFFLVSSPGYSNYNTNSLTIGTMSNPNDVNTFVPLKTILSSEMNELKGYKTNEYWKEHIVYLDNYDNNIAHHYIAIKQNNLDYNSFYIDDFTYESTPTCKEPVNLKLIKSDFESAKVTWENNNVPNNGEWEIQYGISGFAIGTGTTVSSITNITTLTNLLGFTNYDFYVRSNCGNVYSNWSDRGTFKTKCTGVTSGYTYNFENDSFTLNTCWSRTTPDIKSSYYEPDSFINYTNSYGSLPTPYSGTKMMKIFNRNGELASNVNLQNILITPRLLDLSNERKISFWCYIPSGGNYTTLTSLQIGTLSDPEDYNTFVPYESITTGFAINQWKNYTVDFSNYYGTDKFIGIRMLNSNNSNYIIYIDDFTYTNNDCLRPSNLTAAQNGTNSATLSWNTNNNNPINCEIEYGPIGFSAGTGTILTTNTLPFVLTNLNSNTKYQYRVRNICPSNYINWSNFYYFKIGCSVNAPFEENFDQYPAVNGFLIPNFCWSTNENANENIYAGVREYHFTNFNSSPNSGYLYNSNNENKPTYFTSPYLSDFNSTKRVKFWINKNNSSSPQVVTIGTLSNPLDLTTFAPYQILDTANMPVYGKEINIDFANYPGTNKYVAFKLSGSDFSNTYYIDDFKYLNRNTCIEPINIQFLNISNSSALVKWDNTNGENVVIEYGISGFAQGAGVTVNSNLNEVLITNLQPSTKYDFYFKTTCTAGQSITVSSKSFTTTCNLQQLPWIENFSNLSQYGNNLLPTCFSRLAGGTITSYNSPLVLNTNYYNSNHTLNGNGDSTYLWINSFTGPNGYRGIISPIFNLIAGTSYKFSVDARKSYEYDGQGLRMYVGRGNMMHYMEAELSKIGILSEYNYNSNSFVFTPIISGDYSFVLQAEASGSTNMILDNFQLTEGYTNIISNNNELFDFQNGANNKLIVETTQNSLATIQPDINNSSNKLLKMSGSNSSSKWMANQTNTWISNQNNITKVNMKINASSMTSLFMLFDLKQTFNSSSNESMFRVVVNGNVIGDVIKPNSMSSDGMSTLQYDLTPFVGGFINVSLQHIGKSSDNIGDNAYLDNLKFIPTSQLSIDENNFIGLKYYPNPVSNILNIENNSVITNQCRFLKQFHSGL